MSKNDVVIVAELDWGGLHCQSHVIALGFANRGHKVYYINRTLQRWPHINHLLRRLCPKRSRWYVNTYPQPPENLYPFTLWLGPPVRWLRRANRILIEKALHKYQIKDPLVIVYSPTFNAIDIIETLRPKKIIYICYHNFDAAPSYVLPDILLSEKELIKISDVLFADSAFLQDRLKKMAPGKQVFRSMPGVYYGLFHQAFRGDEAKQRKNLYYFGSIKYDLDFGLYEAMASHIHTVFIGVVDSGMSTKIPSNIEVRPPVSNKYLPNLLKEADMLGLFYNDCPFVRGIIPAKFFECLATGKPILVSGLHEAKPYFDVVYNVQGSEQKALEIIKNLPDTETESRLRKRDEIARDADWSNRFGFFISQLDLDQGRDDKFHTV